MTSTFNLEKILIKKLFKWYETNQRTFEWRKNISPYNIMIAEFMLQRTRAEQVLPVYEKFIKKYPDVINLARKNLSTITKYTAKLGMHWRAKHFVGSTKYIIENYRGKFPHNRNELLKIPGVGDYVAGAIMAVCYNNAEYVIDSNIARFINRYYGLNLKGEIRRKKEIKDLAQKLFKTKDQRQLLFSILDFTALVCKPIKPLCEKCILKSECIYYKQISLTNN